MTDPATGLRECPFCGGVAAFATVRYPKESEVARLNGQEVWHYISCVECGAGNRGLIGFKTTEAAITAWNTRKAADALRDEITRLRNALEWVQQTFGSMECDCGEWEHTDDYEDHADGCPEYIFGYIDRVLYPEK
ncbi:Uncharacterized protein DENIS_3477 [Desulfonema ishimotonii]|uniref:Restriction alleviation protein, Lar family n=2 Tax=Desulfonema ishimotonii TaxID=45657 RepID=A0A401FZV5_9BACT|nr:Uncharacterized protein DENIS_3477 [Desulfonema ishimotonii]